MSSRLWPKIWANFSLFVNPPVHAWATIFLFRIESEWELVCLPSQWLFRCLRHRPDVGIQLLSVGCRDKIGGHELAQSARG
jgi:hypothetical protein